MKMIQVLLLLPTVVLCLNSKSSPSATQRVLSEVKELYADSTSAYAASTTSGLTELSHSLQAAAKAEAEGASDFGIAAALLHDIGWKLSRKRDASGGPEPASISVTVARPPSEDCIAKELGICGAIGGGSEARPAHEDMGAAWLRLRGFDEECATMVEGHVLAKRYFVGQDPNYVDGLSKASVVTLAYQGGPMLEDEAKIFRTHPLFEQILALRKRDESAKLVGQQWAQSKITIDHFLPALERCITREGLDPQAACKKHFVLDEERKLCHFGEDVLMMMESHGEKHS